MDTLSEFLESKYNNSYINLLKLQVYVRKGIHLVNNDMLATLDIANVLVYPKYQNQGHFKAFLKEAEDTGYTIYVESISNPILLEFLSRLNYTITSGPNAVKIGIKDPPWYTKYQKSTQKLK